MGGKAALAAASMALVLLLTSCIGVESDVTFDRDGSGVLKLQYRIAKSLLELGGDSDGSQLPLPKDEKELRRIVEATKGLRLVRAARREDEKDVYLAAEIAFERVESIAEVEEFSQMPMSLERRGDEFVFRQVISEGSEALEGGTAAPEAAADAEAEKRLTEMFAALFEGYELVFVIHTPRAIKSASLGEVAADRRSLTYRIELQRAVELPEEAVLTVVW